MSTEPTIRINVDPTNPGQFFACCGLLELADRLWPGAEGWFEEGHFSIDAQGDLKGLIDTVAHAELISLDPENKTSTPIEMKLPLCTLRLNWWHDDLSGGRRLKVWAGTMESARIAIAMQHVLRDERYSEPELFDIGQIVPDPNNPKKKVEPYYFDARRGPNAHSRDVGFSINDLGMTTTAHPAVEFFCLVGLQRCLPATTSQSRVYDYFSWNSPISAALLSPVVAGKVMFPGVRRYRFENWYRTGQRKHKAFRSAIPIPLGD